MTGEMERAYPRTGGTLLGYITGRVSDVEEAQDILHDTFVRDAMLDELALSVHALPGAIRNEAPAHSCARNICSPAGYR